MSLETRPQDEGDRGTGTSIEAFPLLRLVLKEKLSKGDSPGPTCFILTMYFSRCGLLEYHLPSLVAPKVNMYFYSEDYPHSHFVWAAVFKIFACAAFIIICLADCGCVTKNFAT